MRLDAYGKRRQRRRRRRCRIPGHGVLLVRGPREPGALRVVVEQVGVGEVEDEGAEDFGEAAADDDAVEQARVIVADRMRLLGTARAAEPDGERRHAEVFDEALLHHHERFRGEQVLAVVAEHVQARRRDRVSLAQHEVLENAAVADA